MAQRLTDSRLANLQANTIYTACTRFQSQFKAITGRARARFAQRDWHGMQADAAARLDIYRHVVDQTVAEIRQALDNRLTDIFVWGSIKAVYSGLIAESDDWEIAETFFNSITRRIFTTVGVNPQIEFVDTDFEIPPTQSCRPVYRTYARGQDTTALTVAILSDYPLGANFENLPRDARLVAARVDAQIASQRAAGEPVRAEVATAVFYRGKGAYLVGRIRAGDNSIPLALALLHTPQGIIVDAVLLSEREVSVLFSFTRSYFHIQVDRPYDMVRFLRTIMPRKRIAELYTAIGYHKHGKTELYRDLLAHLATSEDQFEIARGQRGMVMSVFTLPSYDLVFKVIKDRFDAPKDTTRKAVMEQYQLVFKHDRAGRLVDAQEFEYLQFDRRRFSAALLDELQHVAGQSVVLEAQQVIVKHAYVERRVTPLDLYVRESDADAARAAVVDYGHAIKDLAATDIFPGDILLKNFGVTRQGRVVFYDYDELCRLLSCHFRALPQPKTEDEELSGEPWFFVGEHDIFPEELRRFLGLHGTLRDTFLRHHADLFDVHFWQQIQARLRAGEVLDIFPYPQSERLGSMLQSSAVTVIEESLVG
ncbi:MAG TPA: bifunctional isocitrate dehydrogenase kinase/phosphatase [Roseiflexaceae bacterium]|nr:bifunctional isocitrate dehydrogenase kinase/phosphatase [Roseiflexaceae bacterium]